MRSRPRRGGALCALLLVPLTAAATGADAGARVQSVPPFVLGLPDKPWQLLVELPGFEMEPIQRLSAGARVLGSAEGSGFSVSLTLATSPGDPSARSCRDHDWAGRQRTLLSREDTHLSEAGDRARVEFLVPSSGAETLREKHILLYLQRDSVCAIVHLSKVHYQPADDEGLERLLTSVRLGS